MCGPYSMAHRKPLCPSGTLLPPLGKASHPRPPAGSLPRASCKGIPQSEQVAAYTCPGRSTERLPLGPSPHCLVSWDLSGLSSLMRDIKKVLGGTWSTAKARGKIGGPRWGLASKAFLACLGASTLFHGLRASLGYLCMAIPGSWARRGLRRHRSISSPMDASLRATWFLQEGTGQSGVVMLWRPYHPTSQPSSCGTQGPERGA